MNFFEISNEMEIGNQKQHERRVLSKYNKNETIIERRKYKLASNVNREERDVTTDFLKPANLTM